MLPLLAASLNNLADLQLAASNFIFVTSKAEGSPFPFRFLKGANY